jgi:inositol oxygenase
MQVTGLVHDLGKLLFLFDSEGQWDVVGVRNHLYSLISELDILIPDPSLQDTFVVGCCFSDKIIYPETFAANPDSHDQIYSTENGIYQPRCGLDNVMLSWGHDEVGLMISQNPPSGSLMQPGRSIYTMSSRVSLPSQKKALR